LGDITIRKLDDAVVSAIKRRAAEHGVSMEEEVRRLLSSIYNDGRQKRGQEWARRQLERLKRGKLPKDTVSSVEIIRSMREDREQQLMDAIEGRRREPRR
jgi:plasmid stability protein